MRYDENEVTTRLLALAEASKNGISALKLSNDSGVSVVLAREQLISAESAGLLCRDESVNGLKFFPNFFPRFA